MREGQKQAFARQLRRSMTDAEQRLWQQLRRKQMVGCRFRRQHPIGPYIADFACIGSRLVIEVDGGQHDGCQAAAHRDEYLRLRGFEVLRFWNNEVLENMEGVCEVILRHLSGTCPHPGLPPQAGEGEEQEQGQGDTP